MIKTKKKNLKSKNIKENKNPNKLNASEKFITFLKNFSIFKFTTNLNI